MIQNVGGVFAPGAHVPAMAKPAQGASFKDALAQAQDAGAVRFSAHAQERLQSRQIDLSREDHVRLDNAVERASQKGASNSLVMLDNLALIVSVQNRTVITAMGNDQAKDRAFTNIDSAVIA